MPAKPPLFKPAFARITKKVAAFDYKKKLDEKRGSANARGYDSRWQRERKRYLAEHPLCVKCLAVDVTAAAQVVDHIIPHKGDKEKFWDISNWQPLCKRCHNSKTAREDSGFARRAPRG